MSDKKEKHEKHEKKDKSGKHDKKEKKAKKEVKDGHPPLSPVTKPASAETILGSGVNTDPVENYYTFGRQLGKGAFSVVKEATEKKSGQKFAIKVIQKDVVAGDDIKLLRREVAILKSLNHPNITKLYEIFEDNKQFFLVLELVEGCQLFDKIVEKGQYSEKDAQNTTRQVIEAVRYLHSKGVAHRDLKPENLLSVGSGDKEIIKVADFGLSKSFSDEKMMTACGSPLYVAPEVLEGEESYGKEVDMWSIGVILYVLLVGYTPFYGDTDPELFKKIIACDYRFGEGWGGISEEAKDLIRHLLVKDSKKRFTPDQALEHPWLKKLDISGRQIQLQKLREYVTKSKLQAEEKKASAEKMAQEKKK